MASIVKIEGIGDVYRQKLQSAGVKTVEKLLKAGNPRVETSWRVRPAFPEA